MENRTSKLKIAALIISILAAWVFCIYLGVSFLVPKGISDPCGQYTRDFLYGSFICALMFAFISFIFRSIKKITLVAIILPSFIIGLYFVGSSLKADDSISGYGYLAMDCHVLFGQDTMPDRYKPNVELKKEWDMLQSKFLNREITKEEFEEKREALVLKQEAWEKENKISE